MKQLGYFFWFPHKNTGAMLIGDAIDCVKYGEKIDDKSGAFHIPRFAAFTVAELGEILPSTLGEPNAPKQIDVEMYVYHSPRRYEVVVSDYVDIDGKHLPHQIQHAIEPTEADARAKMLIYLLENKLIALNSTPKQPQEDI